jgi:hypothetical protein
MGGTVEILNLTTAIFNFVIALLSLFLKKIKFTPA